MMICIEMLEAENLQLRTRLDKNKEQQTAAASEPPTEEPTETQDAPTAVDVSDEDVAEIDDADIEAILASVANDEAEDAA